MMGAQGTVYFFPPAPLLTTWRKQAEKSKLSPALRRDRLSLSDFAVGGVRRFSSGVLAVAPIQLIDDVIELIHMTFGNLPLAFRHRKDVAALSRKIGFQGSDDHPAPRALAGRGDRLDILQNVLRYSQRDRIRQIFQIRHGFFSC